MYLKVGDIITTKKNHPCGNNEWMIIRTGTDFKIKCQRCNHIVMLSREKLEKSLKSSLKKQKN